MSTKPQYGFFGRNQDIQQIEKCLSEKRNILLIHGRGGAGKSTLLNHLAAEWHNTNFVQRYFYFSYAEKAWTLQQIMTEIAQQLYGTHYYTDFEPLSHNDQRTLLIKELCAVNHLLILDNLESITGAHLAIRNTLNTADRDDLRRFLAQLVAGQTLVLLASRGSEDWLAGGTFEDNLYDLGGLDPEAASTLADRILESQGTIKYRQEEDLQHLLTLLGGFPLVLEVVLTNLTRQTPKAMLQSLHATDINFDASESRQEMERIARSVEYTHSNLSPDAQHLLLYLSPFTTGINLDFLEQYAAELKQQSLHVTPPFERWGEILHEVENGGLLTPDSHIPHFLHLQPVFLYFLRNLLSEPERAEMRRAVGIAFCELYDKVGYTLGELLTSADLPVWR
jgi:energy-coupling factor transporter ATP-binding protein EcfA2